jgi:hypothetical protein
MFDQIQNLPPDARDVYKVLLLDVLALARKVKFYLELFDRPECKPLLQPALSAFHIIEECVGTNIILTIFKLQDHADSNYGATENLTFAKLAERLRHDPVLDGLLKQFKDKAAPFVKHRHKLHAHSDLETRIGTAVLPTLDKSELGPIVEAAHAVINRVAASHNMATYEVRKPGDAGPPSDADELLRLYS